jgi:hypothetical protein
MRSATLTRTDKAPISDIKLRLDVLEQRGQYFANPVKAFIATNGPGSLGAKVQFQIYLTTGIDSIEILRNTARDFASATTLQTYALSDLTINKPIVYYDHDKTIIGHAAYYWIRVIPKPGKFQPIVQGPQIVAVPPVGDTTITATNDPSNTTNHATVDSIDAGTSATARIYGVGGVGTSWVRRNGYGTFPAFPAGTITGLAYATPYYVMWTGPNPTFPGAAYAAFSLLPNALPDNFVFVGKVTTVASGGGGGTSGGGGGNGIPSGCCEVGTKLKIPPASRAYEKQEPCNDWIDITTEDGYFVAVARNTLVSTFIRAQDLPKDCFLETEHGFSKLQKVEERHRESIKRVLRVEPGHVYFAGGIRLHNFKPL